MQTATFALLIFLLLWILPGMADQAITEDANFAIRKGLEYLVRKQCLEPGKDFGAFYTDFEEKKYAVATTSFACLAFLANGSIPGQGKYGKQISYGLDFILSCVGRNGYISRLDDESRMHGHGFAVLFLAETYGMLPDSGRSQQIYETLKKATALILQSQTDDGGWGYLPGDKLHEGSITVCELQALRSARNVGIRVPKQSIDRAVEYLRRSANPDGSFKYRLGMTRAHASFPLTAAGVSSLNATGEYDSQEIQRGLDFMMRYLPLQGKEDDYYKAFYFYGQFYAAQAMYQAPPGYWEKWYPNIRQDLIKRQRSDGSWGSNLEEQRFGPVYPTAVASLILQIPYHYLPIFQR